MITTTVEDLNAVARAVAREARYALTRWDLPRIAQALGVATTQHARVRAIADGATPLESPPTGDEIGAVLRAVGSVVPDDAVIQRAADCIRRDYQDHGVCPRCESWLYMEVAAYRYGATWGELVDADADCVDKITTLAQAIAQADVGDAAALSVRAGGACTRPTSMRRATIARRAPQWVSCEP